ncbi:MAG: hypothetical protein MJY69_07695 [Bacteroidales bacterium]|nr:hypothetical protein [Bacteroidales bacterium]
MKERHIIYLATVLALCSCVNTLDTDVNGGGTEEADNVISFCPDVRPLTKAHNIMDSAEDMQAHDMSLYGWTFVSGRAEPAFTINNLPLIYDRLTSGEWDYAPHQYWIPSVDRYGFGAILPYNVTRNDPIWTPSDDPARDSFRADDVVRNDIVDIKPRDAYLTQAIEDVLVGYKVVEPSDFGNTVEFPMEHTMSAFRIRVRNLTETPFVLTNWYLTGLRTHIDMVALIIGRNADGNASQVYTRIPDKMFSGEMIHAPVGQTDQEPYDFVKLHIDQNGDYDASKTSDYIKCEDPANTPNNYKYLVISQRLKESDAAGASDRTESLKSTYASMGYTNYSKHIYWGRAEGKGMNNDHYFMPFIYQKGATMFDYNGDGIRDNKEDGIKVRVYECRSHMFEKTAGSGNWYADGGIYFPVSAENEALLYSPYFSSSEKNTGNIEDWKESMGAIAERSPSHSNSDGSYSIFRWDADHANPYAPTDLTSAISNYNAKNNTYPASVTSGDLIDALNDDGYVLTFPQDVSNLELNFTTAGTKVVPASMADVVCNAPVNRNVKFSQAMDIAEWKPGYKYDYLVTVTSESITITLDLEPWHDKNINL